MLMKTPEGELLAAQLSDATSVWTACRVFPGMEKKARYGIEAAGFGCFAPTYVETVCSPKGVRQTERPLLGPYVLVSIFPEQFCDWSIINAVEGVARLLAYDGRPLRVDEREVHRLTVAHAAHLFDFTTYKPGWQGKVGKTKSTKPKLSGSALRAKRKAKDKIKKLRKMRRHLDRMLAESRKG